VQNVYVLKQKQKVTFIHELLTVIQEMEKGELNLCLTIFYTAERREDGTEFKVSSLKAICAAID